MFPSMEGHHCFGAVAGGRRHHAGALQGKADHVADMRFVIDDEDAMRHDGSCRNVPPLLLSFFLYLAMVAGERR
jgi:hypothetical protein